ncbi:MAG: MFS transporter [Simkaniaceae bacterium]|nr:MFS transporter [Simkaniaceae bacterium]
MPATNHTPEKSSTDSLYTRTFFIANIYIFFIALNYHNNAIYPLYVTHAGGNAVMVGLFMSVFSIAAVLGRPVIGPLIDRFGVKYVMIMGCLCMGLPSLGYLVLINAGLTPTIWLLRAIQGFGFGAHFSAFFTLAAQTAPVGRRNESVAMYGISGMVSIMIGPFIGEELVETFGLPTFFIVMAALGITAAFLATLISIPHFASPPLHKNKNISVAIKNRKLYFPLILAMLMAMSLSAPSIFLAPLAELRSINGFSLYFTGYAVSGMTIRIIGRKWADQFGWRRILIPSFSLCSVGLITIYFSQSIPMLFSAGMIIGIAQGLALPAVTSLGYSMAPEGAKGTSMALVTGMVDFGVFMNGIILGQIARLGGYAIIFPLATIAPILAVTLLLIHVWKNPRHLSKEIISKISDRHFRTKRIHSKRTNILG